MEEDGSETHHVLTLGPQLPRKRHEKGRSMKEESTEDEESDYSSEPGAGSDKAYSHQVWFFHLVAALQERICIHTIDPLSVPLGSSHSLSILETNSDHIQKLSLSGCVRF